MSWYPNQFPGQYGPIPYGAACGPCGPPPCGPPPCGPLYSGVGKCCPPPLVTGGYAWDILQLPMTGFGGSSNATGAVDIYTNNLVYPPTTTVTSVSDITGSGQLVVIVNLAAVKGCVKTIYAVLEQTQIETIAGAPKLVNASVAVTVTPVAGATTATLTFPSGTPALILPLFGTFCTLSIRYATG